MHGLSGDDKKVALKEAKEIALQQKIDAAKQAAMAKAMLINENAKRKAAGLPPLLDNTAPPEGEGMSNGKKAAIVAVVIIAGAGAAIAFGGKKKAA